MPSEPEDDVDVVLDGEEARLEMEMTSVLGLGWGVGAGAGGGAGESLMSKAAGADIIGVRNPRELGFHCSWMEWRTSVRDCTMRIRCDRFVASR